MRGVVGAGTLATGFRCDFGQRTTTIFQQATARLRYFTMATMVEEAMPTATTAPKKAKLHGRAFYESIGSPKYMLAPMVDQSEFAWRMLSRSFMPERHKRAILAYTPMFHARLFSETQKYRDQHFQPTHPTTGAAWLDGNPAIDRPLFVQFCANDPQHLLSAAKKVEAYCDAVDLNLGCPQGIAKKGKYGSFLQEDQELIFRLINTLHENLDIPVTAKIRILDTKEATLAYAQNVLRAGASILTVHGRRREQKGHLTGLADWQMIRFLRDNLPKETVLFANGNILEYDDIERCLEATGADGVMSAEGNLSNPGIFAPHPPVGEEPVDYWRGKDGKGGWRVDAVFRRYLDILHEYVRGEKPPARRPLFVPGMDIKWLEEDPVVIPATGASSDRKKSDVTSPNYSALQAHMFHLLRHFVSKHHDVRDALARARLGEIEQFEAIYRLVERKVAEGLLEYERTDGKCVEDPEAEAKLRQQAEEDPETSAPAVLQCKRPWWVVQPIIRPLPKEAMVKGAVQLSKKDKKRMAAAAEAAGKEGETNGDAKRVKGDNGLKVDAAANSTVQNGDAAAVDVPPVAAATEDLEKKTAFQSSELVSG
ncbi:putative tRNA-dihydrouridine synthase [Podospora australis]|uniref:tRNA-dihydrouridine(16/17) synthase [NAD(P)(+)] n=1 Tax=Podospora australis TaxID=1536484 RepID=A0AAN6WQP0_9PEZI|nr:putative tRNA-dihydrouridine synthase [Podospora australis]